MGRDFKDRTRFIGEGGLWYYDCINCEMFQPEFKFGIRSTEKFGVDTMCKLCRAEQYDYYQRDKLSSRGENGNRWISSISRTMTMKYMGYSDYYDTMCYLNSVGYDTNENIHTQFINRVYEKYGVILKEETIPHTDKEPYPFKSPYKDDTNT